MKIVRTVSEALVGKKKIVNDHGVMPYFQTRAQIQCLMDEKIYENYIVSIELQLDG